MQPSTYPPFATSIHYTISEYQPTRTAHQITATELLDDVRVRVSALRADEPDCEVRAESRLVDFMHWVGEREWLSVCRGHDTCEWSKKKRAWAARAQRRISSVYTNFQLLSVHCGTFFSNVVRVAGSTYTHQEEPLYALVQRNGGPDLSTTREKGERR